MIAQAIHDVGRGTAIEIMDVKEWLGSHDFEAVCHLAMLDDLPVCREMKALLAIPSKGMRIYYGQLLLGNLSAYSTLEYEEGV